MSMRQSFAYNAAIGATSAANARVTPVGIHTIRLSATNDCYVVIGTTPVATIATGTLIKAVASGELFSIAAGEQVAVIASGAGGTLNITEMTQ